MTEILRDPSFDPADKELHIAWSGDKDLGDHELRRLGRIEDAKLDRLGASLYPEGYVTAGDAPTVAAVSNLLAPSNDFTAWAAVNGATVVPAFLADRYGVAGRASRLVGLAGQDAYIERTLVGAATGRKLFALDILADNTPAVKLAIFDGVAEVGLGTFTPQATWSRVFVVVDEAWSVGADDLTVRIRPGIAPLSGSVVIAMAQVEDIAPGADLVPGVYVETTSEPVTGPGHVVTVPEASVYLAGLPRPLPAATIAFDPLKITGVDTIYAELAERYVLGIVDAALENPITGRPGNDSVREETAWVTTDTSEPEVLADPVVTNPQYRSRVAVPVYQFDRATNVVTAIAPSNRVQVDDTIGMLPGNRIAPQSIPEDRLDLKATEGQPGLLAATARRTRNIAGGFVVPHVGEVPVIAQVLAETALVRAKVEPLDGYTPDGRSHYLDEPGYVETPLQASTATRANEGHVFYTGTDTYALAKKPVVSVLELAGYFEVTRTITRGAVPGGQDDLPDTPVFQVLEVKQGATVYDGSPGGDYIQVGDTIDWSPNGVGAQEPAIGSSYTVKYLFRRVWPGGEYTFDAESITFTGANRPVDTLPFDVSYTYGQDRVDLVILGQDGLAVLAGIPSDHPTPPPVPRNAMALWEVVVGYDTLAVEFVPRFVVGVPMAKLIAMQAQLAAVFYNVAQLSASVSLRDRLGTLAGTITDPYLDDRQLDPLNPYYGLASVAVARIEGGRLKMARTATSQLLTPSVAGTTMARVEEWAGIPYAIATPANLGNQQYSGEISVNPFSNFDLIPPLINVSAQAWGFSDTFGASVTVDGVRFQPNEPNIAIKVDGVTVTTVPAADAQGRFSHSFAANITASSLIEAVGLGGTPRVSVAGNIGWPRRDPAAQTFALEADGDILGVDLYFTSKDTVKPVVVTLRQVVAGMPTEQVVPGTLRELLPADVNLAGLATRVLFKRPIAADGDVGYGVVAASDSGNYKLALAQLGKLNLGPGGGAITKNAYSRGVMLASSDGRTWTPYQDQDLRFQVLTAAYDTTGPKTLLFDTVTFPGGVTSFELRVPAFVSQGATLRWEYSTNPGDAVPAWVAFNPGALDAPTPIALGALATELRIRAIASTATAAAGVAINAANARLTGYLPATESAYVAVQTPLLAPTSTAKAFTKVALVPGTDVVAYATNDDGATWVAGVLDDTRQLDQELTEQAWSFTFGAPGQAFRGRLDLEGTLTASPEVEESSFVIQ